MSSSSECESPRGDKSLLGSLPTAKVPAMNNQDRADGWDNGVRTGKYRPHLSSTIALERNLLGVPTSVLHAKSAKLKKIVHEWYPSPDVKALFVFSRPDDSPLPLPLHAMYLDILLAMFANNFNAEGWLQFRFSDLLRNAGKHPANGGDSLKAAQEAIRRYFHCQAQWHYSWKGEAQSWSGPFIIAEDIWTATSHGIRIKRNPRRSAASDGWHRIRFHPHVVESIGGGFTRVFWRGALEGRLSPTAYSVYRHFYGFSDRSDVRRSLDLLRSAFVWQSRPDRFRKWLEERLLELKAAGYVEGFEVDRAHAVVKCTPLDYVKKWSQPSLFLG